MAKRRRTPPRRTQNPPPAFPQAAGGAPIPAANRRAPGAAAGPAGARLSISASEGFAPWLDALGASIGFTTYQTCRLFLLGVTPGTGRLSLFERVFDHAMGLYCGEGGTLHLATKHQVWRLEDILQDGESNPQGYDRQYIPRVGTTTGDIDSHDLVVDGRGRLLVVSTRYSCLAEVGGRWGLEPIWKPPFVTQLVPEDRCHFNGLAMRDGEPAFATVCGLTDSNEAWRKDRTGGGAVVDIASNEVAGRGFTMPHSPRWRDGRLWLLDSGAGNLGTLDLQTGQFQPVAFGAGYLRGLAFHGNYAIVGLSKCRENRTFQGMPLDDALKARGQEAQCGLDIIDLRTGERVHWLRIEGPVIELYDVQMIPGAKRPCATGFLSDEIAATITLGGGPEGSRLRLDRLQFGPQA